MKDNASSKHLANANTDDNYPSHTDSPGGDLDLLEIGRVIWRRKVIILGTILTLTLAAATLILTLTPKYTAIATVAVNAREQKVVDVESVLAGLPPNAETVQTEIQVLQSRELAARVIDQLHLGQKAEFNPALRPPPWYLQSVPPSLAALLNGKDSSDSASDVADPTSAIDIFLGKLDVAAIGQSRAIAISLQSEDPEIATNAVNALADQYIDAQRQTKLQATERANAWLQSRLEALRTQAEASQRAVEAYRRKSGLLMSEKDVTLPTMEVSELSSQLAVAQARRAETEAQLQQAESAVRSSSGASSVPEVLSSGLIQRLREQEATLMDTEAQYAAQYGSNYPSIATVRSQLETTRHKLSVEVDRVIAGLRNQVTAAQIWEDKLRSRLSGLKQQVGTTNEAQGELQILQGEANANQTLYDTFLARFKQTSAEDSVQQPDAQVISHADIPSSPTFPKKKLMLAASIAGSAFIGLMLAFAREMLDDGLRSAEQIYAMGFRALCLVPSVKRRFRLRRSPADSLTDNVNSAFAESIRSLNVGVLLANGALTPKMILIASSMPNEGKTTLGVAWARLLAMNGKKVIVVDCDLRRPRVHKTIGSAVGPGLVDCLLGTATIEQAVRRDSKSPADVICAGTAAPDPSALLASEQMKNLLANIAQRYDLAILDSAPVLAVSDARVLCRLVDKTVYLVRWGKTRRKAAANGLGQIAEAGGEIAGVVLTLVDVKRHAQYGFSDSGYFYGSLAKYYSS
jgi:succinoglycan biosynthesis transport protein ExoP